MTTGRRVSHRGCRKKGSDYEREVAAYLTEHTGHQVRRALLSGGGRHQGTSDLEGLPGYTVECKRTESLRIYDAMAQSIAAAANSKEPGLVPVVVARRNSQATGDSLVVMRLSDWAAILKLPSH